MKERIERGRRQPAPPPSVTPPPPEPEYLLPHNPERGWVYVLRIDQGPTKIGMTRNRDPYPRIRHIRATIPAPVELVGIAGSENVRELERALHQAFGRWQVHGEWFSLTDAHLEQLLQMARFKTEVTPYHQTDKEKRDFFRAMGVPYEHIQANVTPE